MQTASADSFREWGAMARAYDSPLYAELCAGIAADKDLLALAKLCSPDQPAPNMLMGASHYLLMRTPGAPLRRYYVNLTDIPLPPNEAFPLFRTFCLERRDDIAAMLQSRRTQTNAVRRCTFLLPAFQLAARMFNQRPFGLIEIGCSAGLLLGWDRYGYRYDDVQVGNGQSTVQLRTTRRGARAMPLGDGIPQVQGRVGIDINPIDLTDPDEADWIDALIWPELAERRALLQNAVEMLQAYPVELVQGDGIAQVGKLAARFERDVPLVVFHSIALYQVSAEKRQEFLINVGEIARVREVVCISAEWIRPAPTPELHIHSWQSDQTTTTKLANMDAHGRWIEWLP